MKPCRVDSLVLGAWLPEVGRALPLDVPDPGWEPEGFKLAALPRPLLLLFDILVFLNKF